MKGCGSPDGVHCIARLFYLPRMTLNPKAMKVKLIYEIEVTSEAEVQQVISEIEDITGMIPIEVINPYKIPSK